MNKFPIPNEKSYQKEKDKKFKRKNVYLFSSDSLLFFFYFSAGGALNYWNFLFVHRDLDCM